MRRYDFGDMALAFVLGIGLGALLAFLAGCRSLPEPDHEAERRAFWERYDGWTERQLAAEGATDWHEKTKADHGDVE